LPITANIGPSTPGDGDQWRVMVTENEGIESDPVSTGQQSKEWRTIYADCVAL
jgi:hypothetical protein